MDTSKDHGPRRELKSRNTAWARTAARWACASGLSPNAISVLSIVFAAGAMTCFLLAPDQPTPWRMQFVWWGAAACIQMRLLCNLLDGMVAVEGGKGSPTGAVYNEVPDRIADVLILVGAGYSTSVEPGVIKLFDTLPLGWACAVLALGTAYLRLLQGTLTGRQSFMGPMAKQHRMFVLTLGALFAGGHLRLGDPRWGAWEASNLELALIVIFIGSLITCARRLALIIKEVRQGADPAG